MAQTRFLEYLADDDTFSLNLQTAGIFPSGCYRGFDTAEILSGVLVNVGNIMVQFKHEQSGFSYRDKDGITRSNNALCISKQGVKIVENAPYNIQVTEVISGQRIDAIVMRHFYATTEGGTYATFLPIEGTSTNKPTVQIDDVLIGWLLVTPTSVVWQKVDARQFGALNIFDQQNVFTAKQMSEVLTVGVIGGVLNVSEGNIFKVAANTINFITHTQDAITGADKSGAKITIFALSDFTISDYLGLQDQGYTAAPNGQKWVNTNTGQNLLVKSGGMVELIEMEDFYQVVNVYDSLKNIVKLSNDLNNKQLWWMFSGFVSSVKQVISQNNIASSINSDLFPVESGIIKTGGVASLRNIINVEIEPSELVINSIQTAWASGSVVYINFFTSAPVSPILSCTDINSGGVNRFRSSDGVQFTIKNNSIARFLQLDNGLYLIGGLQLLEEWITPPTPSAVSVLAHNGPLKYKICESGRIELEGSISISSGTPLTILFSIPRSLFKFADWSFHKRLYVPPFEGSSVESNYLYYFIEGNNVRFAITTNNYAANFCFNGLGINYK